ncbi:MAG: TetR/AcrR family transcriptional regulator [Acidobacteriota bacterium]|nr:TetR/AcrR family transcriptional regulator [Acidobacteriota bacterium]
MTEITQRPMRADARRNYAKLVAAARQSFTETGNETALETVAERAGVGIGTLYRHFPTRQALLEAVYADEVDAMARAADELSDRDPWDALSEWFHQYVGFAATKRALMDALLEAAPDSDVLVRCRTALARAGAELISRAQAAGVVRDDVEFLDVGRMVSQIAVAPNADAEQKQKMLQLVLDGLRYRGA